MWFLASEQFAAYIENDIDHCECMLPVDVFPVDSMENMMQAMYAWCACMQYAWAVQFGARVHMGCALIHETGRTSILMDLSDYHRDVCDVHQKHRMYTFWERRMRTDPSEWDAWFDA
jgi:hypothetical protein